MPRVDLELAALTGGYVQSLAQQGDHAYLGVDKRVWVLDVADPQQPRVVVASDPFPGFVLELAAAGDLLAVRDERGVHILDISDPASPAELAFVETPGYGQGMALDGARLVVSRTTEDDPTRGELRIFDLSNPRQPQEVGVYVVETPVGDTMAIQGDVVYVANGNSQLSLLDISDPSAVALLGRTDLPWVQQIVANGDTVYAVGEGGLHVVDVSDPTSPRVVGRFDTQYRIPSSVAVAGRYAFLADGATDDEGPAALGAVRVIDLADPAKPALAASYHSAAMWPYFVALDQGQRAGLLYLATGDGLEAVDVSSPIRPVGSGARCCRSTGPTWRWTDTSPIWLWLIRDYSPWISVIRPSLRRWVVILPQRQGKCQPWPWISEAAPQRTPMLTRSCSRHGIVQLVRRSASLGCASST